MRGRGAAIFVLIVAAGVILALWKPRVLRVPRPEAPAPHRASAPALAGGAPGSGGEKPVLSPDGEEPSHIADLLNSPQGDIHADLRIVNEVFDTYRSAMHGPNPIGDNAEITAVLTGKNRLGYSFISPANPAINAQGELCDRWGTPFFFHQLGGEQMEIRSAGPDRKLYTPDDEVLTPGLYTPHL